MDYLTIEGVRPYDGRYEFELRGGQFTVREWGWIKRYSGYLPLTFDQGMAGADAEIMAVFGLIALVRAGKVTKEDVPEAWERFAEAPGVVTIRLELGTADEADDADPPASSPSESVNGSSSGDASRTSSETSDAIPRATGTPALVSSGSRPES